MSSGIEERQDGVLVNALTGMGTSRDRTTAVGVAPPQFLAEGDLDDLDGTSGWVMTPKRPAASPMT
jgi:hypothetical protein